MLKTWSVYLKNFLIDRTFELHDDLLPHDREYISLRQECCDAMNQLMGCLEPTERKIFMDYESAKNALMVRGDLMIYRQGFLDGIRLRRLIERVK